MTARSNEQVHYGRTGEVAASIYGQRSQRDHVVLSAFLTVLLKYFPLYHVWYLLILLRPFSCDPRSGIPLHF